MDAARYHGVKYVTRKIKVESLTPYQDVAIAWRQVCQRNSKLHTTRFMIAVVHCSWVGY